MADFNQAKLRFPRLALNRLSPVVRAICDEYEIEPDDIEFGGSENGFELWPDQAPHLVELVEDSGNVDEIEEALQEAGVRYDLWRDGIDEYPPEMKRWRPGIDKPEELKMDSNGQPMIRLSDFEECLRQTEGEVDPEAIRAAFLALKPGVVGMSDPIDWDADAGKKPVRVTFGSHREYLDWIGSRLCLVAPVWLAEEAVIDGQPLEVIMHVTDSCRDTLLGSRPYDDAPAELLPA